MDVLMDRELQWKHFNTMSSRVYTNMDQLALKIECRRLKWCTYISIQIGVNLL